MRIVGTNLKLASQRQATVHHEPIDNLRTWVAKQAKQTAVKPAATDSATISDAGQQQLLANPDAQQKQVRQILQTMFGISNVTSMSLKIDVSHEQASLASSHEQLQQSATGLAYDYQDSSLQAEHTGLSASGTITLDDGRSFNLDLHYDRTQIVTSSHSVSVRAGDAVTQSPGNTPADASTASAPPDLQHVLDQLVPKNAVPSWLAAFRSGAISTGSINAAFGAQSLAYQLLALRHQAATQQNATPSQVDLVA